MAPKALWPVVVVAGVNDKIDFDSGGAKTGTIAPGTYAWPDYLTAVKNALRAALASTWTVWSYPLPTNLVATGYTETFTTWTKTACTVAAAATSAPYGSSGFTGSSITEDTATSAHGIMLSGLSASISKCGVAHTCSFFVKPNVETSWTVSIVLGSYTPKATFLLTGDGSVTSATDCTATVDPLGGSWYRVAITYTPGPEVDYAQALALKLSMKDGASYTGTSRLCGYVWGSKLEYGMMASGYFPNSGITAGATGTVQITCSSGPTMRFDAPYSGNAGKLVADTLGFKRTSLTSDYVARGVFQHQNGWYADDAVMADTGETPVYRRVQTRSISGKLKGLSLPTVDERLITLSFLKPAKTWIAEEGLTPNTAIERLLQDGWARFSWYPDTAAGIFTDYALDASKFKGMPYNRQSSGAAFYSLALPLLKYV